jgi:hypothetical protein
MNEPSKIGPEAERRLPPNAGKGRPKGALNKVTADVKAMVLEALHGAGGSAYLLEQSEKNPTAFLTLVGKVLPLTLAGDPENPIGIVERHIVRPQAQD